MSTAVDTAVEGPSFPVATKALADRGVVVVFSAGNSGPGEGTITGQFKKAPLWLSVKSRTPCVGPDGVATPSTSLSMSGPACSVAPQPRRMLSPTEANASEIAPLVNRMRGMRWPGQTGMTPCWAASERTI